MQVDGREARELTRDRSVQREPAWSPDGRRIAFAASHGGGFDIYTISARGGSPERITSLQGDARTPSWAPDGRIVFAHREAGTTQWDLYAVDPESDASARLPLRLTQSPDSEIHPRVSPDGTRIVFASDRDSQDGDFDIWVMRLVAPGEPAASRGPATRVVRMRGQDGYPAWAPDGGRVAFYAVREGVGSTWVATVDPPPISSTAVERISRVRPVDVPVLASRRGGSVAWSPDGRTLAIGEIPEPEPVYNGNPARDDARSSSRVWRGERLSAVERRGTPAGGRGNPDAGAGARAGIGGADAGVRQRLEHAEAPLLQRRRICRPLGCPAGAVSSGGRADAHGPRARGRGGPDGGRAAAHQAARDLVTRGRRVGTPARVGGRPHGARARRQRCRCRDRGGVRAGRG